MLNIYRHILLVVALSVFGLSQSVALAKTIAAKSDDGVPKTKKHRLSRVGVASFYALDFHGLQMANGDIFDAFDSNTAAHKSLPLGTKLRVTNLSNGRTLYVEIRDRMGHKKRSIDLSEAAAKNLGMHRKGLTRVQMVKISDSEFEAKKRYLEVEEEDDGSPY